MESLSILNTEVKKFEKLFNYGTFRPMKTSVEVRVKDLDKAITNARAIIASNGLNLKLGVITPQLKSFELVSTIEPKLFYRVGMGHGGGMWYDRNGVFHGSINHPKYKMLQCHEVCMPFDKGIIGYLSVTDSLESLKNWFSDQDMEILEPLGFKVQVYEATDYKKYQNHWVINQYTSKMVEVQNA